MFVLAKAHAGGLYQATIVTESCEGGFKATVTRVLLLRTRSASGTEVAHVRFPDFFAESKELAERRAELHFKACAKLRTLGL
jgi:hypothetical protein